MNLIYIYKVLKLRRIFDTLSKWVECVQITSSEESLRVKSCSTSSAASLERIHTLILNELSVNYAMGAMREAPVASISSGVGSPKFLTAFRSTLNKGMYVLKHVLD